MKISGNGLLSIVVASLLLAWMLVSFFIHYVDKKSSIISDNLLNTPECTLSSLHGDSMIDIQTNMNGKRYVLHFFATWCPHCRREHPTLMSLQNDVPIYGVFWKDTRPNVLKWLAEQGNPFVFVGYDGSGKCVKNFGVSTVPQTFVIDERGKIIFHSSGALSYRELMPFFTKN